MFSLLRIDLDRYVENNLRNEGCFIISPSDAFLLPDEEDIEIPPMGSLGYCLDATNIQSYFEAVISEN